MVNNCIMAKPFRPHPILHSARTKNKNTTWDGLIRNVLWKNHSEILFENAPQCKKTSKLPVCTRGSLRLVEIVCCICAIDVGLNS